MTPKQLVKRRKALELSQEALTQESKVSRYRISRFEREYGSLKQSEVGSIIQVLEKKEKEASHGNFNRGR